MKYRTIAKAMFFALTAAIAAAQASAQTDAMSTDVMPIYGEELMTVQEQAQYRERLRTLATEQERATAREEHRVAMTKRARERGVDEPIFGQRYLSAREQARYRERLREAKTLEERAQIRERHREQLLSQLRERQKSGMPDVATPPPGRERMKPGVDRPGFDRPKQPTPRPSPREGANPARGMGGKG